MAGSPCPAQRLNGSNHYRFIVNTSVAKTFKCSIKQTLKLYKYIDVYRGTDVIKHGENARWDKGTEREKQDPTIEVRGVSCRP